MNILRDIARLLAQYAIGDTAAAIWSFPDLKPGYDVWVRVDISEQDPIENHFAVMEEEPIEVTSEVTFGTTVDA